MTTNHLAQLTAPQRARLLSHLHTQRFEQAAAGDSNAAVNTAYRIWQIERLPEGHFIALDHTEHTAAAGGAQEAA